MFSQSVGMFISETHTEAVTWQFTVEKLYKQGRTQYQEYQICDLPRFGKTLFLDYNIQSSLMDEWIYHECMVHPAMTLHPNPRKVVICGGGEGATLRDALAHSTVENAVMIDIDRELIDMVREDMPEWHQGAFDDPRTEMVYEDARQTLVDRKGHGYDVVLSDLPNPHEEGPSQFLFTREYFQICADAMAEDGIFAMQAGSANLNYPECLVSCITTLESMKETFPFVVGYYGIVTTFMMPWGFVLASKKYDPDLMTPEVIEERLRARGVETRYFTPRFAKSIMTLPDYLLEAKERSGRVLTDAEPFVWTA